MRSKYDLTEVQKLVENRLRGGDGVDFVGRSNSIDYVIHVMICDERDAEEYILKGLLRLTNSDFRNQTYQWGEVMDEYGLQNYLGHNWYIKFYVEDTNGQRVVNDVSFHPTEDTLKLQDGRVLSRSIEESKLPEWRKLKRPKGP